MTHCEFSDHDCPYIVGVTISLAYQRLNTLSQSGLEDLPFVRAEMLSSMH